MSFLCIRLDADELNTILQATKQPIAELIATFYLNLDSFHQLQDKMSALS